MTDGQKVTLGVERLVHNLAVYFRISKNAAIFMLETELNKLKPKAPEPPAPPSGLTEQDGLRRAA